MIPTGVEIYVALEPIDMRLSFERTPPVRRAAADAPATTLSLRRPPSATS